MGMNACQRKGTLAAAAEDAMHLACPAADQTDIGDGGWGARNGRVVTTAVRPPVRPAT
jgi:hypothetical protein